MNELAYDNAFQGKSSPTPYYPLFCLCEKRCCVNAQGYAGRFVANDPTMYIVLVVINSNAYNWVWTMSRGFSSNPRAIHPLARLLNCVEVGGWVFRVVLCFRAWTYPQGGSSLPLLEAMSGRQGRSYCCCFRSPITEKQWTGFSAYSAALSSCCRRVYRWNVFALMREKVKSHFIMRKLFGNIFCNSYTCGVSVRSTQFFRRHISKGRLTGQHSDFGLSQTLLGVGSFRLAGMSFWSSPDPPVSRSHARSTAALSVAAPTLTSCSVGLHARCAF